MDKLTSLGLILLRALLAGHRRGLFFIDWSTESIMSAIREVDP